MQTPDPRHPQERTGWNLMLAGFWILLLAGAAYYLGPKSEPVYRVIGNYLMAGGLAVYITGRIIRRQGRLQREREGKE